MTDPRWSGPEVTCVVVAFDRPGPLAALLAGLEDPRVEVVVVNVDDRATVREVAGSRAVALDGNPGYAAAVNAGARVARAPVIVFLNDDVLLTAAAARVLATTVSSGRADVAVPRVVDRAGRWQPTIAAHPGPASLLREWVLLPDRPPALLRGRTFGVQKWRSPAGPELVQAASAAVVAVATSWLRAVPVPEDYFLYWEESDWFWRLRVAGARVLYDPGVAASHQGGRDDVRPAKSRLLARNAVRCVRRTRGRPAAALAWPVVMLWNLRLVVVDAARQVAGSAAAARRLPARLAGLRAATGAWREL